jgi:glycosyltransferase involved in cell wall biosynthesis
MSTRRINVLHLVINGGPDGIKTFLLQLLRAIDRSRFNIGVCSFRNEGPGLDEMRQLGAEVFTLNSESRHFAPGTIWRYFRHIRSRGYEIVHANVGSRIPRGVARLAGCRTIAHVHGFPDGMVDRLRRGDPALQYDFKIGYGFASDSIVACSRHISETLASTCPVLIPKVSVIYNGLDLNCFRPAGLEETRRIRRAAGLPGDAIVVGFSGRLAPLKGPAFLLAAAESLVARYPQLYFLLLGDGPLRAALEQQAASLGERFRFLGWGPVADLLPLFDILVQPSEVEGLGFSILEAMACGIPVVASAVGGIPEAVIHGVTGLLVPPGDSQAIATAIETLIRNPGMRREMGLTGRTRAERVFDSRVMARSFEELYEGLSIPRTRSLPE